MDFVLFLYSGDLYNSLKNTSGGWVEFVSYEDRCLTLIFRGECSKCIILNRCLDWIRQEILRDLGEDVTIKPICKKPFFWDH